MRRVWSRLMAIGAYPDETASRAGRRRIVIGYAQSSVPTRLVFVAEALDSGRSALGWTNLLAASVPALGLVAPGRTRAVSRGALNATIADTLDVWCPSPDAQDRVELTESTLFWRLFGGSGPGILDT